MAAENTITYTINVNPVLSAGQKSGVQTREVERGMTYMRNLIIENAAFYLVDREEKKLTQNIQRVFTNIVEKELARMGREINKLVIGRADSSMRGRIGYQPRGSLSVTGKHSYNMQGMLGSVNLGDVTGPWPARNAAYVRYQRRSGGGGKWFKVTGELGKFLGDASTYTNAYGPVKVDYKKAAKGTPLPQSAGVSSIKTGLGGRRSTTVTFGRVSVSVLGSITTDVLNDPERKQPSPWKSGLFQAFPDHIENKLLNRQDYYRPFLENFLAYYLTRSIPNAVFRKIEEVVANDMPGARRAVGTRKESKRTFSQDQMKTLTEQLRPITQG